MAQEKRGGSVKADGVIKDGQPEEKDLHKKHRMRMKSRFRSEGLEGLADHEALEVLLYFAIFEKNTNDIAHRLIERFGSLSEVFAAPISALKQVDGVGENSATLIRLVFELAGKIGFKRESELFGKRFDRHKTGDYLVRVFSGSDVEKVYAMFYDRNMKLVGETLLHTGSISGAAFSVRDLADAVSAHKASYVVLAHNHPDGVPIPSSDDLDTTRQIKQFFAPMRVTLLEHFIVAGDNCRGIEK